MTHSMVIRGGSVADGTGSPRRTADVAINDGLITEVGQVDESGRTEIDADGLLVTPGFVDIHSHYDGQVTWEERLVPSSYHGVTTVVLGNCGVGFAPVRSESRQRLVELMEGVEDIPQPVLHAGLAWNWESFESYLDVLSTRTFDMDVAAYLPHSAVRFFVMGERAASHEMASEDDLLAMCRILESALAAGAVGFSTSRTVNHRSSNGEPVPTLGAPGDELLRLASVLGQAKHGVIQLITDFADRRGEFDLLRGVAAASGRPVSYSLVQYGTEPDLLAWLLDETSKARADGLTISAQVAPRAPGLLMSLETTLNPFMGNAAYDDLVDLPHDEKLARLRDPATREHLLNSESRPARSPQPVAALVRQFKRMFVLGDPPRYEPTPSESVEAIATRRGVTPLEVVLDVLVEGDGRQLLYVPIANYVDGALEGVAEMLRHPWTVMGLADGGAHVGFIADASFPTMTLSYWGRDRPVGTLPIEDLISRQTARTAAAVGLHDRGRVAPGLRADINVIDFEQLAPNAPTMRYDLPCGGRRLVQKADGYRHTIVGGIETYRDGEATDALPGRIVRANHATNRPRP